MTEPLTEHIVKTPEVCHGAPRIASTRVRVQDVVVWHLGGGWSIEAPVEQFGVTPAQVYAALSYYYNHQREIDQAIEESDVIDTGRPISELRDKIEKRRQDT